MTLQTGAARSSLRDVSFPSLATPQVNAWIYATGQVDRLAFNRRAFTPIQWMNENLSNDAKILFVGDCRTYSARHRVLYATVFDVSPLNLWVALSRTSKELVGRVRASGVIHEFVK